jgi:hypothetical protein
MWYITNVYGPTAHEERAIFTNWLLNFDATPMDSWIILGDFNLIRSPENRNRDGGYINNMLLFNRIISQLDLVGIPLKGIAFTWSNMQDNPLLDWIFTSANWTTLFPHTIASPLAKLSSDHIPIKVQISTSVPRACLFRFEDYWMEFDGFYDIVQSSWHSSLYRNSTQDLVARLKSVRHGLKKWSRNLSKLNSIIDSWNFVLAMLDGQEDQRNLSIHESNFRKALKAHTLKLLEAKRIYWRNRAKIRWAKLGGENTKFFHRIATKSFRNNFIACLKTEDDRILCEHDEKASIIWHAFKDRVGQSSSPIMQFDLSSMVHKNDSIDFQRLEDPFTSKEIDDIVKHMLSDKSPGPDGFNGAFLKRCWPIVKKEFHKLCHDFHSGNLDIQSINTAFITLIQEGLSRGCQ